MTASTDSIGESGVHAVALIFTKKLGWIFRAQHESDYGVDAHVEVVDGQKATGQLIALQIKSGKSYFRRKGKDYIFRGKKKHLDYWANHCLPVFLILHDPESDLTLYRKIQEDECQVSGESWTIEIPVANVLDERAKNAFLSRRLPTEEERRREYFQWDIDLIERVNKYVTTFEFDVDTDPDIGVTNLTVRSKKEDGSEFSWQHEFYGGGSYTVHEAMQERYWYLDYEYENDVDVFEQYESHTLTVSVKPEVLGWLAIEKILREGSPPAVERGTPYPERSFDEDFQDAVRRDWENEC